MKENKFCQSCAMPLNLGGQDVRGTEKDNSPSLKYCSFCYQKGQFLDPEITFEEMLKRGRAGIASGKGNPIMKWLIQSSYPMTLKRIERWKGRSQHSL
jgi:hypothetical protein